jgi:hypothetical protein
MDSEHGSGASRARTRLGRRAEPPCTVRGVDISSKHIYDRSGLKRWERDGVPRRTQVFDGVREVMSAQGRHIVDALR